MNKPIIEAILGPDLGTVRLDSRADPLRWPHLASGEIFTQNRNRFHRDQRADQLLLSNLEFVRQRLKEEDLPDDVVHDLLARLIFVQFLRQRTDTSGNPALSEAVLDFLHSSGTLSRPCRDIGEILQSKEDTYSLFHWLNERFNGDLFPGKGATKEDRESEWNTEMTLVHVRHLKLLSDFVRGDLEMQNGQRCLWPLYSFNAIPLEFISSVYEQFVSKSSEAVGAHYTPGYLVDFILDRVLPWQGQDWDIRILDPSCGSGIFLVKAFQRLVHRWRAANSDEEPTTEILQKILQENLFGVDINAHAIRVASFSLYLAMCDEIDPRLYWKDVSFPRLRDRTLISADFFSESLIFGERDARFNVIIGNAPWGKESLTEEARQWARQHEWPTANEQIGTLFLAKASTLVVPNGRISMLQPSAALLYNRGLNAKRFRHALFSALTVEEIVDFSALRQILFPNSSSPVCLVTMKAVPPGTDQIVYYHPVLRDPAPRDGRLPMEPHDVALISLKEAVEDPWVWTALAWGGRRDLELLRHLNQQSESMRNVGWVRNRPGWKGREGFKRGLANCTKEKPHLADGTYVVVDATNIRPFRIDGPLLINKNPFFHDRDSTDDEVFQGPILLISKTWSSAEGFRAAVYDGNAIFPASSVYGLHFPEEDRYLAESVCVVLNSSFPEWFFTLTSGRAAAYRPEILANELLCLPIGSPDRAKLLLEGRTSLPSSKQEADELARQILGVRPVEWTLVEDLAQITLRDFRQRTKSSGRSRPSAAQLKEYCRSFISVLRAGFGEDKRISASIFQSVGSEEFALRLVAFHLGLDDKGSDIRLVDLEESDLIEILESNDRRLRSLEANRWSDIFYQRVGKVYDEMHFPGGGTPVPTVFLIRPDRLRYWSCSAALRDADSVAADLVDAVREQARDNSPEGRLM